MKYRVRYAGSNEDVARAQELRGRCFRPGRGGEADGDAFDAAASHVLVEDAAGDLACTFRLLPCRDGAAISASYSAQFYDLGRLARYPGPMLEVGRFCIAPGTSDQAVLRLAWGALAGHVAAHGIELLFGCSSFAGPEPEAHAEVFALLRERHLGPRRWSPRVKSPAVFRFGRALRARTPDLKAALRAMPPLLRSYLAMGGWVSDHAVVDADLGTVHVFTGLETRRVPAARVRALSMGDLSTRGQEVSH